MSTASYPWYSIVRDSSLEQGDILRSFEIANVDVAYLRDSEDYDVSLESLDAVIMIQSCDLENNKIRSVVFCPVIDLREFVSAAKARGESHWSSTKHLDLLRQGNLPGYHLISDSIDNSVDLKVSVVDFHELYSAPLKQVQAFVMDSKPRLRLCPPYREHLAQAFARFFMRVGLPVGISKEKVNAAALK